MLVDSLSFDQIYSRQMTIKNAHAETCKWLSKNSRYNDWLNDTRLHKHYGILWMKGKPGTGKSTLMKFALSHTREKMKDSILISFFFNARGEGLEKSTIGAYQSLLLQLLERFPALQCVFDSLGLSTLGVRKTQQWSVEPLKSLLEQAIQYLGKSSVICFIDALDECEEWQIRDMISFFEHIGKLSVSTGARFRVCFASRYYPHITILKALDLRLEEQEGHKQDIRNYVESELRIEQIEDAEQIRTELQEKASGIFMWVILVVGMLNKESDRGRLYGLRERLRDIPRDLGELFRDVLTRDTYYQDELVLCIQWVLFSRQPLRPEQLYFAILSGVEPEALLKWDRNRVTRDVIERFILDCSKGLAEITKSEIPKVQFIHESVKDFLLKDNGSRHISPNFGGNFQGQSHQQLKHCCLNQISIDISSELELPRSLPIVFSQNTRVLQQSAADAFPFLEYAIHNVLYHANVAAGSGIVQTNFIQSFPLANWVRINNLFTEFEIHWHTENVSLLYVLAENNMADLIKDHPFILQYFEDEEERCGPPLFAALSAGSNEAVRTFVGAHAADLPLGSWLHKSCSQYCEGKDFQGRLRRDFTRSSQRTILSYLAELGDEVLFALALQTGKFDINSKDNGDGWAPLLWAVVCRHEAVVKLLLETDKVEVDSKDNTYGRTALSLAAESMSGALVKLLLETGKADVNSKDKKYGRTPLSWAAQSGCEAVVKPLLGTDKVEVNSKDWNGRTPLSWAADYGHTAVVELLLKIGKASVNSKDQNGRTPLGWAESSRNETVANLLRLQH
jgi:ankyrin repeat protein